MLIFVYFSCNSLVKNHHGSPTGLHGSPTVRLPSGPVQSGRSSPVWSGPVCYGPVRYGPVQPVRSDLVWSGDPWSIPQIGLVWSGLGGFQKIRSPISRSDRTVRNKWPAPIYKRGGPGSILGVNLRSPGPGSRCKNVSKSSFYSVAVVASLPTSAETASRRHSGSIVAAIGTQKW